MTARKHEPKAKDAVTRYDRLMPRHASIDLLILKAHLLIEEQMQLIIAEHFGGAKLLDEARFSFPQKLWIVRAITDNYNSGIILRTLNAIDKLNKLRNSMAHNVEANDLAEKIDCFISMWEEKEYKPSANHKERTSRLRSVLNHLFQGVVAIRIVEE